MIIVVQSTYMTPSLLMYGMMGSLVVTIVCMTLLPIVLSLKEYLTRIQVFTLSSLLSFVSALLITSSIIFTLPRAILLSTVLSTPSTSLSSLSPSSYMPFVCVLVGVLLPYAWDHVVVSLAHTLTKHKKFKKRPADDDDRA